MTTVEFFSRLQLEEAFFISSTDVPSALWAVTVSSLPLRSTGAVVKKALKYSPLAKSSPLPLAVPRFRVRVELSVLYLRAAEVASSLQLLVKSFSSVDSVSDVTPFVSSVKRCSSTIQPTWFWSLNSRLFEPSALVAVAQA